MHTTAYTYRWDGFIAGIQKYENSTLVDNAQIVRGPYLALQERDSSNATTREYAWGLNFGGGIGGLLNLRQNASDLYYLFDGKGNVSSLLDSTQTQVAQYKYDAFGRLMQSSGTVDQPFQFSTKRYDPATGLSYYGFRFYAPAIERWMNRDPLGEAGGINLYGFAQNDPVNFVDPWGLYWFRQDWQKPTIGREGTIVEPGGPISSFLEDYMPAGHTFGELHDAFDGWATSHGVPDLLANIPSMSLALQLARYVELLRSLRLLDQPTLPLQPCSGDTGSGTGGVGGNGW